MSHSKTNKRGNSLYLNQWNPFAKKYINMCCLCGKTGYNPVIDQEDFIKDIEREKIHEELTKAFPFPLALDEFGRCISCAALQDK